MAKERARRRAIRENERLEKIALAKEKQRKLLEKAQRREAIAKKFSIKVQPGALARRRRRRFVLSIFFLFMLNIFIWLLFDSGYARFFGFALSLIFFPVIKKILVEEN